MADSMKYQTVNIGTLARMAGNIASGMLDGKSAFLLPEDDLKHIANSSAELARLIADELQQDQKRVKLLSVLAEMPDEAFGWFVALAIAGYPEGLGGFRPESREAIEDLRKAANQYRDYPE